MGLPLDNGASSHCFATMVSDRSLRMLTRRRLLDGMVRHVLCGSGTGTSMGERGSRESVSKDSRRRSYLVLITDKWTLQLLERVCQMHDLLSEGIALVECLDSRREALPLDALYFLAPTMENMDRLVEELSTKPKYRSSHVFFSHRLEDLMLQRVAESYEAVARISSFAELNVSMLCYDDRSFQLQDQGDALKQLLGVAPQGSEEGMDLRQVGSCLATFFASMGQEPLVFCAGNRGCELEEMETHGAAWRDTTSSETCSLLIVDRSFDWAPVLVHDMGYEALMFDLLGKDGASLSESRFTFTDRSDGAARRVVLGEEADELWHSYRHMAMYEVNEMVVQEVRDWSRKDLQMRAKTSVTSSSSVTGSVPSMPKMVSSTISAVQALPDHKDRFRKLQIHLEICERCSEVVSSPKFQEMIALEQDLVTKGLNPKSEKELLAFLQDPAVKANLKLRLLMLCEACGEGHSGRLEASGLTGRNASRLRRWSEVMRKQREAERRDLRLRSRARSGSIEGDLGASFAGDRSPRRARLWRCRPRVTQLLQEMAAGSMDSQFRCMRNLKRAVGRSPNSSVVVFVVGGLTLPEVRAAHEVTTALPGVQAYVGGSCLLTPGSFIELWESF